MAQIKICTNKNSKIIVFLLIRVFIEQRERLLISFIVAINKYENGAWAKMVVSNKTHLLLMQLNGINILIIFLIGYDFYFKLCFIFLLLLL